MTDEAKVVPKVSLELTVPELAQEIYECCQTMAPVPDLDMSDCKYIAGWLYAAFKKER